MRMTLLALLTGQGDPDLGDVARAFALACDAAGGVVHLSDGRDLRVGGAWPAQPLAQAALRIPVGHGVVGLVARNGHAVRLGEDRPRNSVHRQLLGIGDGGFVARMCLPARGVDGQILAVVAVHRATTEPFSDGDLTAFQPYADALGLRLQATALRGAADAHRHDRDRLLAQAISAQEAERRRIAFDLHDGVSTALASMSFHLNAAELTLPEGDQEDRARAQLATARQLADLAYHQTRAAITGLHSLVLDDLGLVAALESLAETAPVPVELQADAPEAFADLPDHVATALFRMAQESVSNAVKHAQADQITVSLRRTEDSVVLGTSDDGQGFDVRAQLGDRVGVRDDLGDVGHFGLSSLAERCALIGAALRIESMPGRGTTVIVELLL